MPLRPVSELGLVEVTDLGPREGTDAATRRPQTRERKRASSSTPGTSTSTSERRPAQPPRKSPSASASHRKEATQPRSMTSKPTSAGASTTRASKRSGGEPKPARHDSSGTKRSVVVDTGLSLPGGAIGVAAGLLVVRSDLQG